MKDSTGYKSLNGIFRMIVQTLIKFILVGTHCILTTIAYIISVVRDVLFVDL